MAVVGRSAVEIIIMEKEDTSGGIHNVFHLYMNICINTEEKDIFQEVFEKFFDANNMRSRLFYVLYIYIRNDCLSR